MRVKYERMFLYFLFVSDTSSKDNVPDRNGGVSHKEARNGVVSHKEGPRSASLSPRDKYSAALKHKDPRREVPPKPQFNDVRHGDKYSPNEKTRTSFRDESNHDSSKRGLNRMRTEQRHSPPRRSVDIVGLLVKDEEDILPYWLAWHSAIFGVENIVVVDQMCNEKSINILRDFEAKGGTVVWRVENYAMKGDHLMSALNLMQRAKKEHVRFFFPLDVDEFIVAGERNASTAGDDAREYRLSPVDVRVELSRLASLAKCEKNSCPKFSYFPRFISSAILNVNDTVETISTFCVRSTDESMGITREGMQKKFFYADDLIGLDHGSHFGKLRHGNVRRVRQVRSLRLLHYHMRNPEITAKKAMNDIVGFGYDRDANGNRIPDGLLDAHLTELFKREVHVNGYHKLSLLLRFRSLGYSTFISGCGEDPTIILPTLPSLIESLPASELSKHVALAQPLALSVAVSFFAVVTVLDFDSGLLVEEFVRHHFWQGADFLLFIDKTLDGRSALKAISIAHSLGRANDISVIKFPPNSMDADYAIATRWFDVQQRRPYLVAVLNISDFFFCESRTLALRLRDVFLNTSSSVERISCESRVFPLFGSHRLTQEGIRERTLWRRRSRGQSVAIWKYESGEGSKNSVCPEDVHLNHYDLG